jgi:hypothetical protein
MALMLGVGNGQAHTRLTCAVSTSASGGAVVVTTAAGPAGPVCPAGHWLNGSTDGCFKCAAGRWGSIGQTGPCVLPCDAGHECPEGATSAKARPCQAGRFSGEGAGECTLCAAGRWSNSTALPAPCEANCTAGYACPAGSTNRTAAECQPGKYSLTGSGVCTPCQAGRWSSATARWYACDLPCREGHQCPEGSRVEDECPAGYYSNSNASECGVCPAGKYSLIKASVCNSCSAGKYSSRNGSTECTDCPMGKYSSGSGASVCTE